LLKKLVLWWQLSWIFDPYKNNFVKDHFYFSELREHITPDMINMIKQQRLNFLMDGSKFTKYNFRGKVKGKS
jgi:hypothetical protein